MDRQNAIHPRVVGEADADLRLAVHVHHEQNVIVQALPHWAAENDDALVRERIHERRVLLPPVLIAPAAGVIPAGTARLPDHGVVGHRARVSARVLELRQPPLQEAALGIRVNELQRAVVGRPSAVNAIEPPQQLRARGVQIVVVVERRRVTASADGGRL
jgi:hypothetical protein